MNVMGVNASRGRLLWFVVSLMMFCFVSAGINRTAVLEKILTGYDKRIRPSCEEAENSAQSPNLYEDPPVRVRIQIYIESVDSIKETTMDFSITLYLRMYWRDNRLAFKGNHSLALNSQGMESIWIPDVYFVYEKQANSHKVIQPNQLLRIEPNGDLSYSGRFSVTIACNMALQKFPMDSQKCTIIMSSYAYRSNEVILYAEDNNSIIIEPNITISKFKMMESEVENRDIEYSIGNFSGVRCHFSFNRQLEAYFLTVYIPTVLLVCIAWLSFWIDAKAAPARVALGITTVLTVTTMTSGIQNTLPVVTYAKAIDIWLVVCLMFVFISLLEYGVANYLLVTQLNSTDLPSSMKGEPIEAGPQAKRRHQPLTANQLDRYARWTYPFAFLAFNICYWWVFLTMPSV